MTNPLPSQKADFAQLTWDAALEDDCRQLVRLAIREDLGRLHDWTTLSLIAADLTGSARVVTRQSGVAAGLKTCHVVLHEVNACAIFDSAVEDGQALQSGDILGHVHGNVRDVLTSERIMLNVLGRLCGVASHTKRYVDAIAGTKARIYDTRKTTPGWRRLEKLAVSCGGGFNHRTGLFDAILIKDNHLAFAGLESNPAEAVRRAKAFVIATAPHYPELAQMLIEIEVDTIQQLQDVLLADPDIILLDNMTVEQLRAAVALRNAARSHAQLEASGGITLQSLHQVAETGVDRISVGALTHSAIALDIGLDWEDG
jgi:nicotinate-nucleotide pyrophosphorylase (carboxylating)